MIVYCINNRNIGLELDKPYTVIRTENVGGYLCYRLEGLNKLWDFYNIENFETLDQRRKDKLLKIKSRIHESIK